MRVNYFTGGMMMPGRNVEHSWSRHGYNGQAKDDEVYGKGNLNTALFWEMDTRILKRWNVDPKPNSAISLYATFNNNPIIYSDPLGDTTSFYTNSSKVPILTLNDNNPNAVNIIDDANASSVISLAIVYNMAQINKWDQDKINAVSSGLQQFGITYDIQSFSDFAEKYPGSKAEGISFSEGVHITFQPGSKFTLDGKPFTPRGEAIGNLVLKNGRITAGIADESSKDMTRSYSGNLPNEPGKVQGGSIHLHPKGGLFAIRRQIGTVTDITEQNLYNTGPSPADRSGHLGNIRRVLVENNKITLYNGNYEQDIIVDKPKPSSSKK